MSALDKKLLKILGKENFELIKNFPEFYKKVYLEVLKIPKGKVKTYKQIAESLGNPFAYRAVGNALKRNPLTITIPCHRVIKSSGEIGKYSRGIKKKYKLLISEGAI